MELMGWSRGEAAVGGGGHWPPGWVSYRAQEPAWCHRACPWSSGSILAALGHTGREEGQARLKPGKWCGTGGCNGKQVNAPPRERGYKTDVKEDFPSRNTSLPCPLYTSHLPQSSLAVCTSA